MGSLRNARAPLAVASLSALLAACGGGGSPSVAAPSSQGNEAIPAGTLVLVDAGTSQVNTGSYSLTSDTSRTTRALQTSLGVLEISGVEAKAFQMSVAYLQADATRYLVTWARKSPDVRQYGCASKAWQASELAQLAVEFNDNRLANLPACDASMTLDAQGRTARFTGMTLATQTDGVERVRTSLNTSWTAPTAITAISGSGSASGSAGSSSGSTTGSPTAASVPTDSLQLRNADVLLGNVLTTRASGDPYATAGTYTVGGMSLQALQLTTNLHHRVSVTVNPANPSQYLVLVRLANSLRQGDPMVQRQYVCRSAGWSAEQLTQIGITTDPRLICAGSGQFTVTPATWNAVLQNLVVPDVTLASPPLVISLNTSWAASTRTLSGYDTTMGMYMEPDLPTPDGVVVSQLMTVLPAPLAVSGTFGLAPVSTGGTTAEDVMHPLTSERLTWRQIGLNGDTSPLLGMLQNPARPEEFVLYLQATTGTLAGRYTLTCRSVATSLDRALEMNMAAAGTGMLTQSGNIEPCLATVTFDPLTDRLRIPGSLLTMTVNHSGTWDRQTSVVVNANINIGAGR